MFRKLITVVALFSCCSFASGVDDYTYSLGVDIGNANGDEAYSFLGARAGYKISKQWTAEIAYRDYDVKIREVELKAKHYPFDSSFGGAYISFGSSYTSGDLVGLNITSELGQNFVIENGYTITPFVGVGLGENSQILAGLSIGFNALHTNRPRSTTERVEFKPVTESFIDSDYDGVVNQLDQCNGTDAGLVVDGVGCPIIESAEDRYRLEINFEHDSSKIDSQSYSKLTDFAIILKNNPDVNVVIHGHTSISGPAKYNKLLSKRRADSVVFELTNAHFIDAGRLKSKGWGEEKPIVKEETSLSEKKNRRVEAEFIVKKIKKLRKTGYE